MYLSSARKDTDLSLTIFLNLISSVFGLDYGIKVMFNSPSVVTFKYYVLTYSEAYMITIAMSGVRQSTSFLLTLNRCLQDNPSFLTTLLALHKSSMSKKGVNFIHIELK